MSTDAYIILIHDNNIWIVSILDFPPLSIGYPSWCGAMCQTHVKEDGSVIMKPLPASSYSLFIVLPSCCFPAGAHCAR